MLGKRQPSSQHQDVDRKVAATSSVSSSHVKASPSARVVSSSRVPDSAKETIMRRNPFVSNPLLQQSSNFKQNQVLQNLKSVRDQIVCGKKSQYDSGTTTERTSPEVPVTTRTLPKLLTTESAKAAEPTIVETVDDESFARLSQMADELAELDQTKILSSLNRIGNQRANLLLSPQTMVLKSGSTREFTTLEAVIQFSTAGMNQKQTKPAEPKQHVPPASSKMDSSPISKVTTNSGVLPIGGQTVGKNPSLKDTEAKIQSLASTIQNELEKKVSTLATSASKREPMRIPKSPNKPKKDTPKQTIKPIPNKTTRTKSLQAEKIKAPTVISEKLGVQKQAKRQRSVSKSTDSKKVSAAHQRVSERSRGQFPASALQKLEEQPDEKVYASMLAERLELNPTYEESHYSQQPEVRNSKNGPKSETFAKIMLWHRKGIDVFSIIRDHASLIRSTSVGLKTSKVDKAATRSKMDEERTKIVAPRLRSSTTSRTANPPAVSLKALGKDLKMEQMTFEPASPLTQAIPTAQDPTAVAGPAGSKRRASKDPQTRPACGPTVACTKTTPEEQAGRRGRGRPPSVGGNWHRGTRTPANTNPHDGRTHDAEPREEGWHTGAWIRARQQRTTALRRHEADTARFLNRLLPGVLAGLSSPRTQRLRARVGNC